MIPTKRIFAVATAALCLSFSAGPVTARTESEALIRRIEFSGLRRVSSETLRARISTRVGQGLEPAQLEADVRALDRLGWFDDIRVETEPAAGARDGNSPPGVRVVFRLQERPFLAEVEFRGSRALRQERIEAILKQQGIDLPVARPVNRANLIRAARLTRHALADLGYPDAQVQLRLETVPTAAVRAIFEIRDGPRITVASVTFSGVHAFSEKILLRRMKRVAPEALFAGLRDKDVYTPERLAEDVESLENMYRDNGYPFARLGPAEVQVRLERARRGLLRLRRKTAPRFHILIRVDEGTRDRIGAVQVQGDPLTSMQIERMRALPEVRALGMSPPFSQQKIEQAREAVARALENERKRVSGDASALPAAARFGPAPGVAVVLQEDRDERKVRVTLRVSEARPYIVRRLEFSGLRRFSDRYYRRHIGLAEGDVFDAEKIESGLAQVSRAGYIRPFHEEDLSLRHDEDRHTVDVSVRIEELGRQKISLVGGSAGMGSTAGVVYNVFNLLGGEELLTGHLEGGPDSLQAILSVAKEAVFGTRVSLGLSLFQNVVRPNLPYAGRRRHLFTSRSTGLNLAASFPVSPDDALGLSYGLSHTATQYHLFLPPSVSGIASPSLDARATRSAVGWHWSHTDAREHIEAESSVSGGWLGGSENQIRPAADYTRLLRDPFTARRNTWAIRTAFAGAASYGGTLGFQDRLFAGDDFVRGFRTGELGPYAAVAAHTAAGNETYHAQSSGADLVGAVNAEYRMPVAPRTELAPFFDSGSDWLLPNWMGPNRPALLEGTNGTWRASTGVEIRWRIPGVDQLLRVHLALNPLRLARALPLPDGSRFHPPDRLLGVGWALGDFY